MNKKKIAIIEDDYLLITSLRTLLSNENHIVTSAMTYIGGRELIEDLSPDLCLIDINLDLPLAGLELVKLCEKNKIACIVLSNEENFEAALLAYQHGAHHVMRKKNFTHELLHYVDFILKNQNHYYEEFFKHKFITKNINLQSKIKNLFATPLKYKSLFFSGPSGCGKTHFASLVHEEIHPQQKFIHVNCAELPETLLESELFGHQKGAFTGADRNYAGKLLQANGGTLFLDEIGCISWNMQSKLLRVLETKIVTPLGSNQEIKVNFTLMSATWENIPKKIHEGTFRSDLYQRLFDFHLDIPSLSERVEDIEDHINHFLKNTPRRFMFSQDAITALKKYSWPGNHRELLRTLKNLSLIPNGEVSVADVQKILFHTPLTKDFDQSNKVLFNKELCYQKAQEIGFKNIIQKIEQELIIHSLEDQKGKITDSMKALQLSPSSFYRIYNSISHK